jgi:hypothetical protein
MSETPNLKLPYLLPAQAQKHVTLNESLQALDALVQPSVLDRDLALPPSMPGEGARYIVAAPATGAWAGQSGNIAAFIDGSWRFHEPAAGWTAFVRDEARYVFFDGSVWQLLAGSISGTTPTLGVNATADLTNRLAVSAPCSSFSHEGTDHRLKINKATIADTASVVLQTAFSGRAEIGLAGDDDLSLKASADGSVWRDAMVVASDSGRAWFPQTPLEENLVVNGEFAINQRGFAGGALAAGAYGYDRWKGGTGGGDVSVSGGTVTLASGAIAQVIEAALFSGAASTQLMFTVENLAGGSLSVTIGSASATVTPGTGPRSVVLTPATGGNLTLRLAPSSGAVTFTCISLAAGSRYGRCRRRPLNEELALCQRYCVKSYGLATAPGNGAGSAGYHLGVCYSANNIATQRIGFPGRMRTAPTLTFFAPNTGQPTSAGKWQALGPSLFYANATSISISENGDGGFVASFVVTGAVPGSAYLLCGGWLAEAEL